MSAEAPDTLTVRLADGTGIEEQVACVPGGEAHPLDTETIVRKMRQAGGDPRLAERILAAPTETPLGRLMPACMAALRTSNREATS